jgi:hypothetical protein
MRWSYKHKVIENPQVGGPTIGDLVNRIGTESNNGATNAELAAGDPTNGDQKSDSGSLNRGAARAAIEADGYKGVRDLAQAPDGQWTARALRGATEIAVSVAADGSVSAK